MTDHPQRNLLGEETSPYLQQHKDNPVHWRPWGEKALEEARAANKPVLLSVGYAACHWCHVMAHESFENDAIAGVMNDLFVNIKVDREERPDIDTIYMNALALLGQPGGWPLTMFLTPDGEPFWGGTYFPPEAKWGRPGFPEVLRRVADIYHSDKDLIEKNRTALVKGLAQLAETDSQGQTLRADSLEQVAEGLLPSIDFEGGGMSGAPKFPSPPIFKLFFRAAQKTGNDNYGRAVSVLLERMSEGGIYDHLGGGYARYSVDARWLAPHFEKMLYDNAQILDLLTWEWQRTGDALLKQRAHETVDWIEREMIAANGAFAATLDADSEGEEGKFYVWSENEIRDVLGRPSRPSLDTTGASAPATRDERNRNDSDPPFASSDPAPAGSFRDAGGSDADLFCRTYDVSQTGNWEGTNILNRLHLDEKPDAPTEARLRNMRAVLFDVREKRIHPGWDDKVLADWNGLMIAALAEASVAFGEPEWMARAKSVYDSVLRDLGRADGEGNARLMHSFREGRAQHEGMLDDYANMARAALTLHEHTGEDRYLSDAEGWAATLYARFWDVDTGGFFFTADDAEALIVRTKSATDNAVPAGNGVMVEVLAKLALLTGKPFYRELVEALISAFVGTVSKQAPSCATLITAFDFLMDALQIVVVGTRGDADTQALLDVVRAHALPNRILQVVAPGADLHDAHPARGKGQSDGKATAYVCRGQTCSLPVTDPADLAPLLRA